MPDNSILELKKEIRELRETLTDCKMTMREITVVIDFMAEHDEMHDSSIEGFGNVLNSQDKVLSHLKRDINEANERIDALETKVSIALKKRDEDEKFYTIDRRELEHKNFRDGLEKVYPYLTGGMWIILALQLLAKLFQYIQNMK